MTRFLFIAQYSLLAIYLAHPASAHFAVEAPEGFVTIPADGFILVEDGQEGEMLVVRPMF